MCVILFILQRISVTNIILSDNVYDINIACLSLRSRKFSIIYKRLFSFFPFSSPVFSFFISFIYVFGFVLFFACFFKYNKEVLGLT